MWNFKVNDESEIEYYLNLSNKLCLTARKLRLRLKSNEYNRLSLEINEKLKISEVKRK